MGEPKFDHHNRIRVYPYLRKIVQGIRPALPASLYHMLLFFSRAGYWPNFKNPKALNEKIWWIKKHHRDPRMTTCSDKLAVRDYAKAKCPSLRFPEVLFVTDDPAQIPFHELPEQCVIKSNHASGQVIFYDRRRSNRADIIRTCKRWLSRPFGESTSEWVYQHIPRRIFGEQRLYDNTDSAPSDYKVFVFNGSAKLIQVDLDRYSNHTRTLYDRDWNVIPVHYNYRMGRGLPRPPNLAELRRVAECLAYGFPFVRVDLYLIGTDIVLGEMTFLPEGGTGPFCPLKFDWKFGEMLTLPVRPEDMATSCLQR